MATVTSTPQTGELRLPLDDIHVRGNVRDLDPAHVDGARAVDRPARPARPADRPAHRPRLRARRRLPPHRRVPPARPTTTRRSSSATTRASARTARRRTSTASSSTPLEEARAVQAMLDDGYTLDGAAQALGWSTPARRRPREDPQAPPRPRSSSSAPARSRSAPSRTCSTVATVSAPLGAGRRRGDRRGDLHGGELRQQPGVGGRRGAAYRAEGRVRALPRQRSTRRTARRCGSARSSTALVAEAETLHKQVESYAYGPPTFRFAEQDVDQARAAGVLIEFAQGHAYGNTAPIITDQARLPRAGQAGHHPHRRGAPRARRREGKARPKARGRRASGSARRATSSTPSIARTCATSRPGARHEPRSRRRADQRPHGRRPDGLRRGEVLRVWPARARTARATWGPAITPRGRSPRTAWRSCSRSTARPRRRTLKSGKPGKTKVAYADVDAASKSLWRFVDGAANAGELYGGSSSSTPRSTTPTSWCSPRASAAARRCPVPQGHRTQGVRASPRAAARQLRAAAARDRGGGPLLPQEVDAAQAAARKKPAAAATPSDVEPAPQDLEDAAGEAALDEDLNVDDDGGASATRATSSTTDAQLVHCAPARDQRSIPSRRALTLQEPRHRSARTRNDSQRLPAYPVVAEVATDHRSSPSSAGHLADDEIARGSAARSARSTRQRRTNCRRRRVRGRGGELRVRDRPRHPHRPHLLRTQAMNLQPIEVGSIRARRQERRPISRPRRRAAPRRSRSARSSATSPGAPPRPARSLRTGARASSRLDPTNRAWHPPASTTPAWWTDVENRPVGAPPPGRPLRRLSTNSKSRLRRAHRGSGGIGRALRAL